MGPVAAEGHGPFDRRDQYFTAVGCLHGGELVEIGGQGAVPGCGGGLDKRFRRRSQRAERDLRWGLGTDRSSRRWARAAVVDIVDGGLTRGNDEMLGDDSTEEHDLDGAVSDTDLDLAADVAGRDRVAGGTEPDATQAIDLADHEPADLGPQ